MEQEHLEDEIVEREATDDELLAELEKEASDALKNFNETLNARNETDFNESESVLKNKKNESQSFEVPLNSSYDTGAAQLTTIQENIITTGSGVSVILLFILAILFVIQGIRFAIKHMRTQRALERIDDPLNEAIAEKAEKFTPISVVDPKSYAVYNTTFDERDEYLARQKNGGQLSILKQLLLKRAVKCIERFSTIQRDSVGIRKNWNHDLLPRDVWDDFNAAHRNIQIEIDSVLKENIRQQFSWNEHKNDIFARAREVYGMKVDLMKRDFVAHRRQMQQNMSRESAPNPSRFGSGFKQGFLQNQNDKNQSSKKKKLSKKEKRQLAKMKKEQLRQQRQNKNNNQSISQQGTLSPENDQSSYQSVQSQPRRRKGKRRFANK